MKFCDYCFVNELKEDSAMDICASCIQTEFFTFDNMKKYLVAFNLVNDYYSEMNTKIFSYFLMCEYVNEDRDHFIEWSYANAEQEKIQQIMKINHC